MIPLFFFGGDPIPYPGLDPIDPQASSLFISPVYGEEAVVEADGGGVPGRGGVALALPTPLLPPVPAVDAVLGQVQDQPRRVGDQEHHH